LEDKFFYFLFLFYFYFYQGDITGTDKPLLRGKMVLQQPVDIETWKPEEV
jgi:hypothetical protein